jgi:hypothetical protein
MCQAVRNILQLLVASRLFERHVLIYMPYSWGEMVLKAEDCATIRLLTRKSTWGNCFESKEVTTSLHQPAIRTRTWVNRSAPVLFKSTYVLSHFPCLMTAFQVKISRTGFLVIPLKSQSTMLPDPNSIVHLEPFPPRILAAILFVCWTYRLVDLKEPLML